MKFGLGDDNYYSDEEALSEVDTTLVDDYAE